MGQCWFANVSAWLPEEDDEEEEEDEEDFLGIKWIDARAPLEI